MVAGAQMYNHSYAPAYLGLSDWTSYSRGKALWSVDMDELTPLAAQQPFPQVATNHESSGPLPTHISSGAAGAGWSGLSLGLRLQSSSLELSPMGPTGTRPIIMVFSHEDSHRLLS